MDCLDLLRERLLLVLFYRDCPIFFKVNWKALYGCGFIKMIGLFFKPSFCEYAIIDDERGEIHLASSSSIALSPCCIFETKVSP